METSVFKDILDHSISGNKIYGGSIEWLDQLETDNLMVPSSHLGTNSGLGSINGHGFNIGNLEEIGFLSAAEINSSGQIQGNSLYINGLGITSAGGFVGTSLYIYGNGISAAGIITGKSLVVNSLYGISLAGLITGTGLSLNSGTYGINSGGAINGASLNISTGAIICGAITSTGNFSTSGSVSCGTATLSGNLVLTDTPYSWGITHTGTITGKVLSIYGGFGISNTGALTVSTISATAITGTGDVNISSGDVKINTIGKGLQIKTGTNSRIGTKTISVANTPVVVSNTSVTANTVILLTPYTISPAYARVSDIVPGTSFTIVCSETGAVFWLLLEPIS